MLTFAYTHILSHPVLRDTVKIHPMLSKMLVIRNPPGTNFRVTQEEWSVLQKFIKNGGENILPRIWKISAGQGGKSRKDFQQHGLIGIGFDEHSPGNLEQFSNKAELFKIIQQAAQKDDRSKYYADQFWYLSEEMSEGDTSHLTVSSET